MFAPKMQFTFIVMLLISSSCSEKLPQWTAYLDKTTAICVKAIRNELHTEREWMTSCSKRQTNYLLCSPFHSEASSTTFEKRNGVDSYSHTLPCGWNQIHSTLPVFIETVFSIHVHIHFHINITFHHFQLPMATRGLYSFGPTEYVKFGNSSDPLANSLILFGRRAPFWILWPDHLVFIVYGGIKGYPRIGSFIMHYQVCEPDREALFVNVLMYSALHKNSATTATLNGIPFWLVSDTVALYSLHIIGSKIRALDLSIGSSSYKGLLKAMAFESPDPFEPYRHPDSQYLVKGHWIFFITFQGYLQVWCTKLQCHKLSVEYVWALAVGVVYTIQSSLTIRFPSKLCKGNQFIETPNNFIFCYYRIFSHKDTQRLHVSLRQSQVAGFDFVGNYSTYNSCLLGGVTIADAARYLLLWEHEQYTKLTGQPLEERLVDIVFPEVTNCHFLPFMEGSTNVTYKLPMGNFTTTSSGTIIIIYAYGHHIDLNTWQPQISVYETSDIGLILSCPLIHRDSFLPYIANSIRHDIVADAKPGFCPKNSFMLYSVIRLNGETTRDDIKLIYCSSWKSYYTEIIIISPLSNSKLWGQNLIIQSYNPLMPQAVTCVMREYDTMTRLAHNYNIEAEVSHSVYCDMFSTLIDVSISSSSEFKAISPRESSNTLVYTGIGYKLKIYMNHKCLDARIAINVSCQNLEQLPIIEPSLETARQSLLNQQYSMPCRLYQLPQTSNETQLNTYMFRAPHGRGMDVLKNTIGKDYLLDRLTANILNVEIADYQLRLVVTANQCPINCKQFQLSIAYQEAVSGQLLWLEWNVNMGISKHIRITISQIPLTDWIIYLTQKAQTIACTSQNEQCKQTVGFGKFSANEPISRPIAILTKEADPVAHLFFIWTQQPHTWKRAETMCSNHGMHLVSLASEAEYLVLMDLLLGNSRPEPYRRDIPVITPCKLETPLCAVYIGMQIQVNRKYQYQACFTE